MNLTEKISYIRGLCDGLELDESKPEVKVLNAIVDLLDDMAFEVSDMEELYDELSAQVDEIDQDRCITRKQCFTVCHDLQICRADDFHIPFDQFFISHTVTQ